MSERNVPTVMSFTLVWVAQMILIFVSLGSAYVPMGPFNLVSNLGMSFVQMLLGALFFMHLKGASPLIRLFSAVGLVWLLLMFGLSLADFLTRNVVPAPW